MSPSCRRNGQRVSAAAATSRTAASAAASSFTACGPRLESTGSVPGALLRQPTSQRLAYGLCCIPAGLYVHLGRCHGEGRPRQLLWLLHRPLLLHSLRSLPGGVANNRRGKHSHKSTRSDSRYEILNSHALTTRSAHLLLSRLAGSPQRRVQVRHQRGRLRVVLQFLLLPVLLPHPDRQPGAPSPYIFFPPSTTSLPRSSPTSMVLTSYAHLQPDLLPTSAPRGLHACSPPSRHLSTQSSHKIPRPPPDDDLPTRITSRRSWSRRTPRGAAAASRRAAAPRRSRRWSAEHTLERLDELNYHRLLLHGPADAHAKVYGVGVRFARPL